MEFHTTTVPVGRLRLDRHNPRLIGEGEHTSDAAIIARLYRAAELDELLQSISANGYLDIEPLIVMPTPHPSSDELIVLEGNRRLAALRLLREPTLAADIATSENLRIAVPAVPPHLRGTLEAVSVYRVAGRKDARSFIGFKHINGPAKWDAYAKARFAAEWYEAGRSEGIDLATIANAIGDRHDTIKRMVSAIYVLDQAKNEGLFDIAVDRATKKLNFSHLYTALSRTPYMDYLGLDTAWARLDPAPDQIPHDKMVELQNVLFWIYGCRKDGLQPVVRSQNPDIKRLGEVLANAQGRHVLELKRDLDEAHSATQPVDRHFTASLLHARDAITDAAGSLRAFDGRDDSLLDVAEDVKETATVVHDRMRRKRQEAINAE